MHENKTFEATFSEKVTVQYSTSSRWNPLARPGTRTARRSVRVVVDDEGKAEPAARTNSAGGRARHGSDLAPIPHSRNVLDEHVGVALAMGCVGGGGDPHGCGTRLLDLLVDVERRPLWRSG